MAQARKAARGTVTPTKAAVPTVDAKLKKRWEEARRAIEAARHDEARDFDALWEAVGDVINSEPPLYLAAGYSSERDFFTRFLKVAQDTGRRKARVARFASAADIEKFGETKVDAVLDYLEAQAGGTLPGRLPVALEKLKVVVERGGREKRVPLADATREQLRAATRARKARTGRTSALSPRAQALRKALDREGLKAVAVTVHRDGFDVRGVPWAEFATFLRAMGGVVVPEQ